MSDWIDHDGKEMPVDGAALVGVRMRDGTETPAGMFFPASGWKWRWEDEAAPEANKAGDIIAYRIQEPEQGDEA